MSLHYKLSDIRTDDPETVARAVSDLVNDLYPAAPLERIPALVQTAVDLFTGRIAPFQALDTHYHDLEHTLQVTLCWSRLFYNFKQFGPFEDLSFSQFIVGFAAALFHDAGYLKELNDEQGTGAKYTLVHESRSCQTAARVLTQCKWPEQQIAVVQRLITSTGPRAVLDSIPFATPVEKAIAQAVASADFLAQLSDPLYLEKLPRLYAEFEEAADHRDVPAHQRAYTSLASLIDQTPAFWHDFVYPRLRNEYDSMYRYLNTPFPDGPNPYLQQALHNIENLSERITRNNAE